LRISQFLALILLCACAESPREAASCLKYFPDTVSISGSLARLTFPGPPNYQSVASGDSAETGFYLILDQPVCTVGDSSSAEAYPQAAVDTIQVALDSAGYRDWAPSVGQVVTISGTLRARVSGHHHAPLLLDPTRNHPSLGTEPTNRTGQEGVALQALIERAHLREGDVACVALASSDTLADPSPAMMAQLRGSTRLVPISACDRPKTDGPDGFNLRDTGEHAALVSLDSVTVARDSLVAWGLWLRGPTNGGQERCAIPLGRLEAMPTCVTTASY
jgi:hypothetical protein